VNEGSDSNKEIHKAWPHLVKALAKDFQASPDLKPTRGA